MSLVDRVSLEHRMNLEMVQNIRAMLYCKQMHKATDLLCTCRCSCALFHTVFGQGDG